MVLHLEVGQLVCDVNQLIGLFISGLTNDGLTIGVFIGRVTLSELTFSCVMLKYGQMCSHSIIFKVSFAVF